MGQIHLHSRLCPPPFGDVLDLWQLKGETRRETVDDAFNGFLMPRVLVKQYSYAVSGLTDKEARILITAGLN
jgi:hypothetical protein